MSGHSFQFTFPGEGWALHIDSNRSPAAWWASQGASIDLVFAGVVEPDDRTNAFAMYIELTGQDQALTVTIALARTFLSIERGTPAQWVTLPECFSLLAALAIKIMREAHPKTIEALEGIQEEVDVVL